MKQKNRKSGSTMAEVLIAFAIFMMITEIFYQGVQLSGNMLKKSQENFDKIAVFTQNYYKTDADIKVVQAVNGNPAIISLKLDEDKTASTVAVAEIPLETSKLQYYADDATGLTLYALEKK